MRPAPFVIDDFFIYCLWIVNKTNFTIPDFGLTSKIFFLLFSSASLVAKSFVTLTARILFYFFIYKNK